MNQRGEKRLLIIGCSNRKIRNRGLMPAWTRYQGGCLPLLKELEASSAIPAGLDILIISAKHGLLKTSDLIDWYDVPMTREKAESLKVSVQRFIRTQLDLVQYSRTLIFLEPLYKVCLESISFPKPIYLEEMNEENLSLLKNWILTQD